MLKHLVKLSEWRGKFVAQRNFTAIIGITAGALCAYAKVFPWGPLFCLAVATLIHLAILPDIDKQVARILSKHNE